MSQGLPFPGILAGLREELTHALGGNLTPSTTAPEGSAAASPQQPPGTSSSGGALPPPHGVPRRPASVSTPPAREEESTSARSVRERPAASTVSVPRLGTGTRGLAPVRPAVVQSLQSPSALRAAVVVSELLGQPRALRPYGTDTSRR